MSRVQKSLLGFLGDNDYNNYNDGDDKKKIEIDALKVKVEKKKTETRKSNQIETDYYEKSRIDTCANILRKTFNVNIDILPVKYGSKPPFNEKIHGYYMLITVKSGDMDRIVEFIRNECRLKVY